LWRRDVGFKKEATMVRLERVSPSMIQSMFGELKANGYSDGQIMALSKGLMETAHNALCCGQTTHVGVPGFSGSAADAVMGQSECRGLLGFPEEFESLYLAGLI
jgi:hypothetical protein